MSLTNGFFFNTARKVVNSDQDYLLTGEGLHIKNKFPSKN
jgi:hypothetical protein